MTGTRFAWERHGKGDRRENKQVITIIETLCCSKVGGLPGRLRSNEEGFIRWLKVTTGQESWPRRHDFLMEWVHESFSA